MEVYDMPLKKRLLSEQLTAFKGRATKIASVILIPVGALINHGPSRKAPYRNGGVRIERCTHNKVLYLLMSLVPQNSRSRITLCVFLLCSPG